LFDLLEHLKNISCSKFDHVICRDENPDRVGSVDFCPTGSRSETDLTCNNGYIKLFSSWTKYKPDSTNSSLKWWFIRSNFMPTYSKYKFIFCLITNLRSDPEPVPDFFSSAEPDPYPRKKTGSISLVISSDFDKTCLALKTMLRIRIHRLCTGRNP